ncbi:MAG: InlB B-repeat-containing protein, partial [Desulfuromonadaceae bacterium]
ADAGGTIVGESRQRVKRGEDGTGVRAQAAEGYAFVAWSDGVAEAVRTERKVNADLRVSARFAPRSYTLTYAAAAGGRIDGDSPQRVSHGGDGRAVTAVPAAGYRFAGWSDGQSEPLRRDLRVTADETVRAQFARLSYALSYRAEANGSLRGTSEQRVEHEGFATPVAAVPDPGYHFLRWSDGSTANPRSDRAVGADLEVRAEFAVNQYRLNYQAGANGAIAGESRQLVNHGGDGRAVTAVPQGNASFVRWSDGVTSATRKEQNLVGDLELTAEFALPSYTVGGRLSGLAAGSRLQLQLNGGAALELSADGSFSFQPPLLDGSDYLVTMPVLFFPAAGSRSGLCRDDFQSGTQAQMVLPAGSGRRHGGRPGRDRYRGGLLSRRGTGGHRRFR